MTVPLLVLLAVASACGTRTPIDLRSRELASEHFGLDYCGVDRTNAETLLNYLEATRASVMSDLRVTEMPSVQVIIHTDSNFEARWGNTIKRSGLLFQVQRLSNGVGEIHAYGPCSINPGCINSRMEPPCSMHLPTVRARMQQLLAARRRPSSIMIAG